jgi:hypothetical protein
MSSIVGVVLQKHGVGTNVYSSTYAHGTSPRMRHQILKFETGTRTLQK